MKFYNPFKPHIVRFSNGDVIGKFAIRKFGIYSWVYLDSADMDYWWCNPRHIKNWSLIDNFEVAKTILQRYADKNVRLKSTVVYNG